MQHQKILILDFGSQVTQLIARRVREAHVYCEVHPCDVSDDWVRQYAADGQLKGVILSGSHASVYEESTDAAPAAVFELGVPVLTDVHERDQCAAVAQALAPYDGILVAPIGETLFRVFLLVVTTLIAGFIPAWMIVRRNTLDSILGRN